ncbi:MAG: Ig domain-containing protein [Bryobacteraceae bacterium]
MIRLWALTVLLAGIGAAQTAALSLSSGSGSPGSVVTLDLLLASTEGPPAALAWTASYATKDITAVSVAASGTTTSISCNNTPGTSKCVVWSLNSNTISNGVVATLALTISSTTTDTSSAIQLSNGDAVSLGGLAIPASSTGSTLTLNVAPPTPVIDSATTVGGIVGSAFSYQITGTNTPTRYGATGLPVGLSVNTATGLISGTPTAAGTSTVTLSATNSGGTGYATLTLTIALSAPVIDSATTAGGTVGSAFSYQITGTNSPTRYGAAGLPAGLSINTATGLISGTPTAAGTSTVTLSAANSGGTGYASLTLAIIPATSASISFVQATADKSSGNSSLAVSFPGNTAAGDLFLVAFDIDSNTTTSTVKDSQGNVFTQVGAQLTSPGGACSRVYYAKNIKGGADTVTITLSANSSWLDVYLTEYSGADRINPIDAQAGTSGSAGAVSSGNATTTIAGDVIYSYCVGDGACTAGSGFAVRSTFDLNFIEDMTASGPGSYAATGSADDGWTMQMVALKPRT